MLKNQYKELDRIFHVTLLSYMFISETRCLYLCEWQQQLLPLNLHVKLFAGLFLACFIKTKEKKEKY